MEAQNNLRSKVKTLVPSSILPKELQNNLVALKSKIRWRLKIIYEVKQKTLVPSSILPKELQNNLVALKMQNTVEAQNNLRSKVKNTDAKQYFAKGITKQSSSLKNAKYGGGSKQSKK